QAAGVAGVVQAGSGLVHAVAHLVAGDVESDQRAIGAATVTVVHGVLVPRGIDPAAADMDVALHAVAVVEDAVATMHVLVIVPGGGHTVVGVRCHGGAVGGAVVAPVVVAVAEQRGATRGRAVAAVVGVVGGAVATGAVDHRKAAAGTDGVQGDVAVEQGLADADRRAAASAAATATAGLALGMHPAPLVEDA